MNRYSSLFLALIFVSIAACGGGNSHFLVPSDTALNPWVEPAEGDLVDDSDDGGDEEEYADYEDGEEGDEVVAPTPPPVPTK